MAKLLLFDKDSSKVVEFVITCMLYIRIRDERGISWRTDVVGVNRYIRKVSKYLERECSRRFRDWQVEILIS